ncbi:Asp-tRNA(Asn)/Glu-tRNA(Gln) amidotransferase subunit GatB [Haloimpatiens lingqiaonensis]|uniref:Asp-tRNA(Asn)/Glu-tRNA(Gln) amidotransferase subunit GatB n=1 Tax=Haloimpatiens lingqiaonensis TaxID=1380675 RepID=UPI0010FE05BE|nr:Asp-tRNA(Asn)/Glu-tRNA(Gln) amidotransferase subunit GatB [Haloimpatiens lingqiaonensis]
MEFEAVIGLEVHVELATNTKIYCGCTTEFGGKPNTHVCPICMGLPGSLPQLNKKVVEYAMKAGIALNCSINKINRMDRKNYFYPDCPKNYQITQDEIPLCYHGYIDIELDNGDKKRIELDRIHIEEDAGKLIHTDAGTLVDYNRAGVPLAEIVSKPDLRSPREAVLYLEKLKSILQAIGVSDCKMEQGSLRCDANISVREKGTEKLGVRTEIKNMNSFKALEKALNYEFERQTNAIEKGEKLEVETRRWNETKGITEVMRSKENANDYRYFPEGDLVTINIDDSWIEKVKSEIPELPHEKVERFLEQYEIPKYDVDVIVLSMNMGDFFEEAAKESGDAKAASNWIMGDISRLINEDFLQTTDLKFNPKQLGELIKLINAKTISKAIGKTVLEEMYKTGKNPKEIVEEKGLVQNSDQGAILEIVKQVLKDNPKSIEDYKKGKTKVTGFLVGQVMKASRGKANPEMVNKLVKEEIKK